MRDFVTVFKNGFKYLWRDPTAVVILTIFPIVMIFVLGNALGEYISPDYDFDGEKLGIAAVTEPGSRLAQFLQSGDISKYFDVIFTDEENARELLENDNVEIIVSEKTGEISVTRPTVGNVNLSIAMSVIDSYAQINSAMEFSAASGSDNIGELLRLVEADISVRESPLGSRVPNATDYYAVTMLVMILMFAGMNGMELFKKGLFSDTGARTLVTPVSKPALVGGLLAASTLTSYLQGMVTFLFSLAVYNVYWGERIPLVLLTLLGVTLFSQSFAIFAILLCKNSGAAMGLTQGGVWVMTFVAGGYSKIDFGQLNDIFQFSPNSLAHTVIFGAAFGGNETKMITDLALLFAYGAVLFALAFLFGKRRLTS